MRSDMGKVVIERPRRGGGGMTYKDVRNSSRCVAQQIKNITRQLSGANDDEIEDAIDHIASGNESHTFPYCRGWNQKEFTDLLGPIEGYLRSRVGLRWDDVWSDACAHLRGNRPVEHVREHVLQMVYFKGNPESTWRYTDNDNYTVGNKFYVDEEGFLQRQIPEKKLRPMDAKTFGDIRVFKYPEDKFWILDSYSQERFVNRYRFRFSSHLSPYDIRNKEKMENFKLYLHDGKEYVYFINSWFSFEYVRLKDLKLNSKLSVRVQKKDEEEIGPRTIWYSEYDILGTRHSQNISLGGDLNKRIRYKIVQVGHSELRRIGLATG